MSAQPDAADELFACAWCTHRVRRSLSERAEQASYACPMCGRPMYPLPETFLQLFPRAARPAIAPAEALSRA